MPASTEGTDLISWFENRETFRQQVRETVEKLNECQRRLVAAVDSRPTDIALTFADETVSGIRALTEEAVSALQQAEAELSQIAAARSATQDAQIKLRADAMGAARQRLQKEAERAAKSRYAARKRQLWIKRKALRFGAVGVLLATFLILYKI